MLSDDSRPNWKLAALVLVGVTAWRLVTLAYDSTDLFMDEAQYWFWGQNLDWGYFSKPPMIAWVTRAVTELAGSNAIFWIRFPGALLHLTTGVLIGAIATKLYDTEVGLWAAIIYVTTPFATLGSWLYSTDTVLLPFYAAAFLSYIHLTEHQSRGWAVAFGMFTGLGILSKYAMLYLPLMVGLAAIFLERARISWRDAGLAAVSALIVASPNLIWNIQNGATTVKHVAFDNAQLGQSSINPVAGFEFFASQFGVFGPVLFAIMLLAVWRVVRNRAGADIALLLLLSLPVVVLMTFQAARALAYANWAVTAYVAGTVLVAVILAKDFPRLRTASLALHGALAVIFPLLYIFPEVIHRPGDRLLAERYLGQAEFSREIAAKANAAGIDQIVASDRDVLADLFHTLRNDNFEIYAAPPRNGRVRHYYEQSFALTDEIEGPVLYVHRGRGALCRAGREREPIAELSPDAGYYRGRTYRLLVVPANCLARGARF